MPILFRCTHCDRRLSVGSRKAGQQSECPVCHKAIVVPAATKAPAKTAAPDSSSFGGLNEDSARGLDSDDENFPPIIVDVEGESATEKPRDDENPFAQFTVFDAVSDAVDDDSPQLVYAPRPVVGVDKARGLRDGPSGRVDPRRLAVPRTVVYAQGVLLAITAIGFFVLGVLVGGAGSDGRSTGEPAPKPCVLRGRVKFASPRGQQVPDVGAIVVAVPQNDRPEPSAKWPVDNLRPDEPEPRDDHPTLRAIRELGGDYTRVGAGGRYRLQVADVGEYFVLFISQRATREDDQQPQMQDLAQMGRYFSPSLELIAGRQYRWKTARIRRDQTLDVIF